MMIDKKRILVTAVFLGLTLTSPNAFADFDGTEEPLLQSCMDAQFGIKILCQPEWELEEYKDALLLVVSSEPAVMVTIARIDTDIRYLSQLTHDTLQHIGQYADGFQVENVPLAGTRSLKVKAFSSQDADVRLLDYYILHDSKLYGLLFSVNPKEEWGQFKFLFDQVVSSLEFVDTVAQETGPEKIN